MTLALPGLVQISLMPTPASALVSGETSATAQGALDIPQQMPGSTQALPSLVPAGVTAAQEPKTTRASKRDLKPAKGASGPDAAPRGQSTRGDDRLASPGTARAEALDAAAASVPAVDDMWPLNGAQVGSVTPTLVGHGTGSDSGLRYAFSICEIPEDDGMSLPDWLGGCGTNPAEPTRPITSGQLPAGVNSWKVPAGNLKWGRSYSWKVTVSDTTGSSSTSQERLIVIGARQPSIGAQLANREAAGQEFQALSGNYTTTVADASVATVGPALSLVRSYNSLDARRDGLFGAGWSTRFDMKIEPESSGALMATYPDGRRLRFAPKGDGTFQAPPGTYATLGVVPGGGWKLMDKSSTVYHFNAAGRLTKIVDARGRSQNLTYGADGKLAKATGVGGRSLTFTWNGAHVATVSTDPVNGAALTWTYTYDGDKLTTVCSPGTAPNCTTYGYTTGSLYRGIVEDDEPVGYWRLGEPVMQPTPTPTATPDPCQISPRLCQPQPTTAADSLGWGAEAAAYTGVSLAQPGALTGSTDTAGGFNGASQMRLPDKAIARLNNQLSLELWFKTGTSGVLAYAAPSQPLAIPAGAALAGRGGRWGNPLLYVGTDGKLRGQFRVLAADGSETISPITTSAAVTDNNWHHALLSGAGNAQTLYVDGVAVGTLSGAIDHNWLAYATIGDGVTSSDFPATKPEDPATYYTPWGFTGQIDEVALYDRPLAATEVSDHYGARLAAPHLLKKITLPSGRVWADNTYDDARDRLLTHTDQHGGTWKLSEPTPIDTTNGKSTVTITDPKGETTRSEHDAWRGYRTISHTDQLGQKITYVYDTAGYLHQITDPNEVVTDLSFDKRGNLLSEHQCKRTTSPLPVPDEDPFFSCLRLGDTAMIKGQRWYEYHVNKDNDFDPRNDRLVAVRDGRSSSGTDNTYATRFEYNSYGEQTKQTTPATLDFPNGRSTTVTYTDGTEPAVGGGNAPAGLVKRSTDAKGNDTTFTYSTAGDLAEQTAPSGLISAFEHDVMGRTTVQIQISDAEPSGVKETFTYDAAGRLATQTAPGVKNEISGVTHTAKTTYTYDPDGNLLTENVTDLTGGDPARTTTSTYDAYGHQETSTDPEGGLIRTTWDKLGLPVTVTDQLGSVFGYTYTKRGELEKRTLKNWIDSPVTPKPAKDITLESFSYDPGGRLAAQADAMGRKASYTYYADDRLAEAIGVDVKLNGSSLPKNVVLATNTYDAAGNLIKKVTGNGITTTGYVYDAANRLTSTILDPANLARKTAYVYDANGLITKETLTGAGSSREEIVENSYNAIGAVIRQKVENGSQDLITTWQVDDRGLITAMTDPRGNEDGATAADFTTTRRYDQLGRLIETTVPAVQVERAGVQAVTARPTMRAGYNTYGNQTHIVDAEGRTSTTSYDKSGRVASRTTPAYTPPGSGITVTPQTAFAYDNAGRLIRITNARGHATTFEHDALGNQVRVTNPPAGPGQTAGQWVSEYDLVGEELAVIDPTGARTQATYDDLGRQITHTEVERKPANAAYITTMTYNDAGDLTKRTLPGDRTTSYEVNAAGEVTTVTDPMNDITAYTYDIAGRAAKYSNLTGNATLGEYDLAGRLTSVKRLDKNGTIARTVGFSYDSAGNVIQYTSGEGHVTRRSYDATNMLTKLIEPISTDESITTSFGYDANGAPTRVTDGRGNATWTTYNSLGLIETLTEPATTAHPGLADRTWTHAYDATGNETALIKPGGVRLDRQFDALDQVTKVTGSGAGIVSEDKTYTYDLSGRPIIVSGQSLEYNDRSLLTKVTSPASGTSSFAYDAGGNPTQRVDATGTTIFTWDKDDRLKTVNDPVSGRINTYDYDKADRLTTITSANPANTQAYTYDALDRPLTHTLKNSSGAQLAKITYGWDKDDNLTSKTTEGLAGAGTNIYGYDHANRLTSWTGPDGSTTTYSWDASGNRIKAGDKTFTYDERNRLLSGDGSTYTYSPRGTLASQTKNGNTRTLTFDAFDRLINDGAATYTYDAFDRMATRQTGAGQQRFVYAGLDNDVVAITDQNGVIQSSFGRDPAGDLVSIKEGGNPAMGVLADHHQDVVGTFSGTALSATTAYSPFGEVVAQSGSKPSLGYQSEYTDPDTGAVNMHARWYQPDTGAFTSRDSWTLPPSPSVQGNRYTYGNGSPLVNSDPTGHWPWNPNCWKVKNPLDALAGLVCDVLTDAPPNGAKQSDSQCMPNDKRAVCGYKPPKPDPCAEFSNACPNNNRGNHDPKKGTKKPKEPTGKKPSPQPGPPNNYHPPTPPSPPSPRPRQKKREPVRKPNIPWGHFCGKKCMIDGNLPLDEIWPVGIDYTGFGGVWFLDGDGPGFVELPSRPTTEPQDDQQPAPAPDEEPAPDPPNGGYESSGCEPKMEHYIDPRDKRPIGGFARYCSPSDLEKGSPVGENTYPRYWVSNNPAPDPRKPTVRRYARCHIIGNHLGGSGTNVDNLVPCLQTVNNGPMKRYENAAKKAVREAAGKSRVDYRVEVRYDGRNTMPSRFRMTTSIDGEVVSDECIHNDSDLTVTDGYYC
ncbi:MULTISPECIES: DNA/RNA non-specific endonuclease [unclassified Nonomuraea]|uniref:DNA/RNA non-specific endonuclease n=1 Tax=unclassified Nonomuraea TaxID=2593643 RepID=UPI0033E03946